jgi:nitrite reductase/ring-hydroxylating ferredoxin subunit
MALLLCWTDDPLVQRRAERVATRLGLTLVAFAAQRPPTPELPQAAQAAGLLVALELDGSVELVRRWRERYPEMTIVAFLASPQPERWREAELAGADAVSSRGRADMVLAECLEDRLSGRRRARRLRVAALSEFAGRLGFVGRIADSPVGAIALYHVGGQLHAIADTCPHAGASLGDGELDGEIVTCPAHGSQFRLSDGERVRGPADRGVARYPVVVEAGVAFVELPR